MTVATLLVFLIWCLPLHLSRSRPGCILAHIPGRADDVSDAVLSRDSLPNGRYFFPTAPGFSGNIERNLPQRTVLAASSLAGLRCMMMSGFLSMLLCTDALVTPPL